MGLRKFNLVANKKGLDKLLRSLLRVKSDVFVIFESFFEQHLGLQPDPCESCLTIAVRNPTSPAQVFSYNTTPYLCAGYARPPITSFVSSNLSSPMTQISTG